MSARVATHTPSRYATCRGTGRAPARGPDGRRSGSGGRRHQPGRPPRRAGRTCRSGTREVVGRDEAVRDQELEVVRVERVRDHEVRRARDLDPVGELVGVRVRVVEEAARPRPRAAACSARCGPCTSRPGGTPQTRSIASTERAGARAPRPPRPRRSRSSASRGSRPPSPRRPSPAPRRGCARAPGRPRRQSAASRTAGRCRCTRQKPTRLPNSNIDSVLRLRLPTVAGAPTTSCRNASEAGSPSSGVFSPPSS